MAEILKEWLSQALGRQIKWEAEEFGSMMKNGFIVATVLKSYNVISDEKHYLIIASNEYDDIKSNWKYLSEWLQDIELYLNEEELKDIMTGKGSSLLRLFYQLFLSLDKRDRTNFIMRERKNVSKLVEKIENRFVVSKVSEEQASQFDKLSKPLLDEKQFIEWQKRKSKQIKETFDCLHNKYTKVIEKLEDSRAPLHYTAKEFKNACEKDKREMKRFELRYPCKFQNYTFEELSALDEKALERKRSLIDSKWANDYMNNIFDRIRKRSDSEEFQRQMGNALSNSIWDGCVTEEENKVDMELAKKVMKLSQFEKQMCTEIMETKQQARNLIKNRIQGEKEYAEEREQHLNIYFDNLRDQIDAGGFEIDYEKNRQNQLHKKLFAEKMKRKRQIYYEICNETLLAIVDYAVKYGYYKKLMEGEIPERFLHEWKLLYYKQQPIFDVLNPVEQILKAQNNEDPSSLKTDELVTIESDRQFVLSDCELQEYLDYFNSWNLDTLIPNYDSNSEERRFECFGLRVLGHVIYTLLELKYPYPPSRLPAELPDYSAKAMLRGLPDKSLICIMQNLLKFRRIHIVRLESVINHCLSKFKTEMIGQADIDLSYDNFVTAAHDDENKEFIKSMKSEDEMLSKSRDLNESDLLASALPNTKQTQTPKHIPEDENILSTGANLGKYAYDALTCGEALTDYLLAAMIVEYLKDQNDIKGFVIINYPNSYRQAQILEEFFSGRVPPDADDLGDNDDAHLEESIITQHKKEVDPYQELRISKIVKNPHNKNVEKPFETYFTSYINLKSTNDILQELVVWELTHDNSDLIDRFYATMGINYSLYYEVVDKDLLAQICKYIIGDFGFPLKSYDELFGENVWNQLDFFTFDEKRLNSKIIKPDVANGKSKEKLRRSSKQSRATIETELEVIKAPQSFGDIDPQNHIKTLESMIAQDNKSKSSQGLDPIKVSPGDENWIYADLPISEGIGISLASYWEEVEKSYVSNIQQMFFAKRLQMNYIVPYTRFIKDKMNQIITLPSNKQDIVSDFQKKYNDFENDWRHINLTKNEWHCRVKELQNKLYKICDDRKVFSQQQRHGLICDNWTFEELTTLANIYISCMQLELNRSIMTFQILHDFYFSMLKGSPSSDRLPSKDLTKIFRESDSSSTASKKGGEEKLYRQLKSATQELFIKNTVFDNSNCPFNLIIENNVKYAIKVIKDINESYRSLISKEYNEKSKTTPVVKKKEDNNSEEASNLEEILRQNSVKCLEEWSVGANGEMFRFNLRIQALQHRCYLDMKLFYDQILKAFVEIQNYIDTYYKNEIKSVDRLCRYFHMAIEKGLKIPETLQLIHDKFVIDPNVSQYSQFELSSESEKYEIDRFSKFKMGQLARLRSQLKIVAPTGMILHQAFIYLLQDFIIFGKESQEGPLFPEVWKKLDPEDVPKLVFLLFGETTYIDWKDFLIYCLQIRFPTIEELLEFRKRIRNKDLNCKEIVSRDDFINEEIWFENDYKCVEKQDQLQLNLVKHFLFELFEISENIMNYSAFLLAFCKNSDPIKGFVAALSIAIGQEICFSEDECGEVVTNLIKAKQYKDECLKCALNCTDQFLNNLIHNVVNECEGTTIEEVKKEEIPPPEITSKKGKKGGGLNKPKKIEGTQAIPSTNSQKALTSRSKTRNEPNESKTSLVCPPCELPPNIIDDTDKETKEHIEESRIIIAKDPNLIYAVSQTVIWNVLKNCLPLHFQLLAEIKESYYIEQVKQVLSFLEKDTENKDIYVCKLVSNPIFCKLLHKVKKFTAINLTEEICNMF